MILSSDTAVGSLARRLRARERLRLAWSGLAEPALAEIMLREGFDAVIVDMQHGTHTVETALRTVAMAALCGAGAIVRVPVGDNATAARLLDGGAAGAIAPMIDTVEQAAAFAASVKYPPLGGRSWGPQRATVLTGLKGPAYLAGANALHLALPMLETRAALEAVDGILALPGIDGVFVGPADLSIALSGGTLDPGGAAVEAALDHVIARVQAAGKVAGLYCADGATARRMAAKGFALCSVGNDAALLADASRAALAAAR